VLVTGIEQVIGVTLCDPNARSMKPMLGRRADADHELHGQHLAAGRHRRQVRHQPPDPRAPEKELLKNVALRVEDTGDSDVFLVSGRGELHLTILLENMRREGYELAVGRPRVVFKDIDGVKCEPYEMLTVDVEEDHQGGVMEELGRRRGELQDMAGRQGPRAPRVPHPGARPDRLPGRVPDHDARHRPDEPRVRRLRPDGRRDGRRRNGVLISQNDGEAVAYALWNLQDRGRMFVSPGDRCTKA
jgi:GTP-binding protein